MEDNFKIDNCNQHEALSFKDNVFKVSQLQKALKTIFSVDFGNLLGEKLKSYGVDIRYKSTNQFFSDGIECEILKFNSEEWQGGKMRIKVTLEFCPNEPEIKKTPEIKEPESPLDDLRRKINEATTS